LDHLFTEHTGILKAFGKEHDLSDHGIIWNHHTDWSKEGFQIVWKFGSACVTWVHCNKDSVIGKDGDRDSIEFEGFKGSVSEKSHSDDKELLGDDGEHLDIDSVELVETSPSALLGQAFE
jgi:hypothetical protein